MAKKVTLKQVAKELNEVMQYGVDPKTKKLTQPEAQIDVTLGDDALLEQIKEFAAEDLRPNDEESFSPEVWEWFADNGITPTVPDADADAEPQKESAAKDKGKDAKKTPAKEDAPKRKGNIEALQKARENKGPSFEQIAKDIVKDGGGKKELLKEFTKLYKERGKDDADFISGRVDIYYNIACKALGIAAKKDDKTAAKGKADKEEAAPAKGKDANADADAEKTPQRKRR